MYSTDPLVRIATFSFLSAHESVLLLLDTFRLAVTYAICPNLHHERAFAHTFVIGNKFNSRHTEMVNIRRGPKGNDCNIGSSDHHLAIVCLLDDERDEINEHVVTRKRRLCFLTLTIVRTTIYLRDAWFGAK